MNEIEYGIEIVQILNNNGYILYVNDDLNGEYADDHIFYAQYKNRDGYTIFEVEGNKDSVTKGLISMIYHLSSLDNADTLDVLDELEKESIEYKEDNNYEDYNGVIAVMNFIKHAQIIYKELIKEIPSHIISSPPTLH